MTMQFPNPSRTAQIPVPLRNRAQDTSGAVKETKCLDI